MRHVENSEIETACAIIYAREMSIEFLRHVGATYNASVKEHRLLQATL